jgi:hypothetical protein
MAFLESFILNIYVIKSHETLENLEYYMSKINSM